jgi:hypothetical protein
MMTIALPVVLEFLDDIEGGFAVAGLQVSGVQETHRGHIPACAIINPAGDTCILPKTTVRSALVAGVNPGGVCAEAYPKRNNAIKGSDLRLNIVTCSKV